MNGTAVINYQDTWRDEVDGVATRSADTDGLRDAVVVHAKRASVGLLSRPTLVASCEIRLNHHCK
jgi:hypothetical protein